MVIFFSNGGGFVRVLADSSDSYKKITVLINYNIKCVFKVMNLKFHNFEPTQNALCRQRFKGSSFGR